MSTKCSMKYIRETVHQLLDGDSSIAIVDELDSKQLKMKLYYLIGLAWEKGRSKGYDAGKEDAEELIKHNSLP